MKDTAAFLGNFDAIDPASQEVGGTSVQSSAGTKLQLAAFVDATTKGEMDQENLAETLTADNFMELLTLSTDVELFDDPVVISAIQQFAVLSSAEFTDPGIEEEDFTTLFKRADTTIGYFIEQNKPDLPIGLLDEATMEQLEAVYTANNLLATAKQLIQDAGGSLTTSHLDMIYRYRTVLHQLEEQRKRLQLEATEEEVLAPAKVGAKTWAGYFHQYGCFVGGAIDLKEFRAFMESPEDLGRAEGSTDVRVGGVTLRIDGERFNE